MSSDRPRRPFDDVRAALAEANGAESPRGELHLDPARSERTGIPEIVYGSGKTPVQVRDAVIRLARLSGRAIATRCGEDVVAAVRADLPVEFDFEVIELASSLVVSRTGSPLLPAAGLVGILAAGTSDVRVASEAALIVREMGVGVEVVVDVGVAGLHRLVRPLEQLISAGAGALVVVAGMDGALPSVVAGLVAIPVIGLPVSTGYGFGGDGSGALMSMLQSCAPGLTVVNIDNGVGAGAAAVRIVRRSIRNQED